jgi:hypothetical protein
VIGLERLPRYRELIRRTTGQDEVIPPGFIIERRPPEWDAYAQVRRWTTGPVTIAANAGNVGHVEVFNPAAPGSGQPGLVVVVTLAKVSGPTVNLLYDLTSDGAAGATPAANFPLDNAVPQIMSQNRLANNTVGVSGVLLDRVNATPVTDFVFQVVPVILRPTHRVAIFCRTQNSAFTAIFAGYERTMTAEEAAVDV